MEKWFFEKNQICFYYHLIGLCETYSSIFDNVDKWFIEFDLSTASVILFYAHKKWLRNNCRNQNHYVISYAFSTILWHILCLSYILDTICRCKYSCCLCSCFLFHVRASYDFHQAAHLIEENTNVGVNDMISLRHTFSIFLHNFIFWIK